jgi:hypothetical protein
MPAKLNMAKEEYAERRRIQNRDYKRRWRVKNRDTDRKRALEQYYKNHENKKNKARRYREENRESLNEYMGEWASTTKGRAKKLVRMAAARARKAGVPFDLDWKWLHKKLLVGKCEATGLDLHISRGISPWSPSLDRKVGSKGYTKKNVRVVVYVFNTAKNGFTDDDVEEMCRAFVRKRNGKKD